MVQQYVEICYWPSGLRYLRLAGENLKKASELAKWRRKVLDGWNQIRIEDVNAVNGGETMRVGAELHVTAQVNLGPLNPDDVLVQLVHGGLDSFGEISHPHADAMTADGTTKGSRWEYRGSIACRSSGQYGFVVRVLPRHGDLPHPFEPGLVSWGA